MDLEQRVREHPLLPDILRVLDEHHAQRVVVLAVGEVGAGFTDWFVIAEGFTPDHLLALRDALTADLRPTHVEGGRGQDWLVVDYVDVVVHLMLPEAREFYNLEGLWGDAPTWSASQHEEPPQREKEVES